MIPPISPTRTDIEHLAKAIWDRLLNGEISWNEAHSNAKSHYRMVAKAVLELLAEGSLQ